MVRKPLDIDSFTDPVGSMMQQSKLAFERLIIHEGTPDGEKAREIHMHMEKQILKHFENEHAPHLP